MTRQDILEAVRSFLAVLDPARPFEDREGALRAALDRLAMAFQFAAAPSDDATYPDPVLADDATLRSRIAPLFPNLGFYNAALNIVDASAEPELGVGDAIDDLIDIARDVGEVLFRWENTSEEDALWEFRFGFQTHWGKHLRSLQLYLHVRAY